MIRYISIFTVAFLVTLSFTGSAQTIVEAHGALHVDGTKVKDECNRVVQLKGMSLFWHMWDNSTDYWNSDVVKWLRDDWKVQLTRGPVGSLHQEGYPTDKETPTRATERLIEAAVEHGIYVVVDWHVHDIYLDEAKEFFGHISKKYGHHPNIIYEIFNEPDYESWEEVKAYSKEIISVIRDNDPDNIILVGSPHWDQDIHIAADDPLKVDSKGRELVNIAYALHFYAGAHQQELRDRTQYAIDKGLCVFIPECGRTGTNWGPNNTLNDEEWNKWMEFADKNSLSWTKWSLTIRDEICGSLKPSASVKGGWDVEKDLTDEGRYMRNYLRENNTIPEKCR